MKTLLLSSLFFLQTLIYGQNYIDTLYQITTEENIIYGESINFAGENKTLLLDISYPTNDTPGACGRPMALIIHGGAWAAGSKNDNTIVRMREDFAKRGYVAVAINYRLGYFPSNIAKNCNIPNWNCLNLADSSEWIRAWYRATQDAKGALRFMINNKTSYNLDPSNIFVFGESAGAYIAQGVGFLDYWEEKPADCYALADVPEPNQSYYNPCIQGSAYDIPIEEMDLSRPDLGGIDGNLNLSTESFIIKGVGSMFGGAFYNLFEQFNYYQAPQLYLFHQPNDLIVPTGYDKIFKGLNTCAMATNCVSIDDRPISYGGQGITDLVSSLSLSNQYIPEVLFENTNNNADCLTQIANPSTGGHQYDSYWNRTTSMAAFFASSINENDCLTLSSHLQPHFNINFYPNPSNGNIKIEHPFQKVNLEVLSIQGNHIKTIKNIKSNENLDLEFLNDGSYLIMIKSSEKILVKRITISHGE
jgi:hypothetical protein